MEDINPLMQVRQEKAAQLREMGLNPYQNAFKPEHKSVDLLERFAGFTAEALEGLDEEIVLAGRVMFMRDFGKLAFFRVQDAAGQIQCAVSMDSLGEEGYRAFIKFVDVGDIVGVCGHMMRTQKGELTVKAASWEMVTKAIRPLPDKWHGLTDQEQRYRQRYTDLIMNADVRSVFQMRSKIVSEMRKFMESHGYMEVETPILHHQAGGATAKPFVTHHNALDVDFNLRIAPELDLKRLMVGGFNRVFELGRTFRNEGVSTRHNPEFTMMEGYAAYMDARDVMDVVEGLIRHVAKAACGSEVLAYGEDELDFSKPFQRLTMQEALTQIGGVPEAALADEAALDAYAAAHGMAFGKTVSGYGDKFAFLFEELCETKLIQPTFIYDFPLSISPLARTYDDRPEWAERAELYICGRETSNLFSELNDPADQARRFREQVERAKQGDDEAMPYDADYIRALEYGMPPAGGFGVGVDRLVMVLTNQHSIRDVLLFPHQRPEA